MADFQTSNIATYQTDDGAPVYDAHFVEMTLAGHSCLVAFRTETLRARALAVHSSNGSAREPVKARDAYMRIKQGEPAWLFEDDRETATCYTPLEISGGFKGGWKPRIIQGGKVA